jgi:DNA-binding IclR family transcriptional regulator
MSNENRVEAVERAFSILGAFREGEEELSLAALAAKTGFYKSTILRLAGSLERFGYLKRSMAGIYSLGPTLWRLGSLYRRSFDLGEHIRPELQHLVEATTETASFYVREGDTRVCLYRLNSPRPVRHHLDEGVAFPLDGGASARVLMAFDGADGAIYAAVRRDGFYVSLGERDPDAAAISVPAFNANGRLRGALAVSALITRMDKEAQKRALEALRESAGRLRAALPQD